MFVCHIIVYWLCPHFFFCIPIILCISYIVCSCYSLQTEAPGLSLGCCVDLIPQVKVILASKYEE